MVKLSWRFNIWRVVHCFWIQRLQHAAATKSQRQWLQRQSCDKQGHTTSARRLLLQCATGIIDIAWLAFCNEVWHVNATNIPFFCNQSCTDTNHGIPNTCCRWADCQCFTSTWLLWTRTKLFLQWLCQMWCGCCAMSNRRIIYKAVVLQKQPIR